MAPVGESLSQDNIDRLPADMGKWRRLQILYL
jgi:hypothetical protein